MISGNVVNVHAICVLEHKILQCTILCYRLGWLNRTITNNDFSTLPTKVFHKTVAVCKRSVTLSNLYPFSQFLHCWKAYDIWHKKLRHYAPLLMHV